MQFFREGLLKKGKICRAKTWACGRYAVACATCQQPIRRRVRHPIEFRTRACVRVWHSSLDSVFPQIQPISGSCGVRSFLQCIYSVGDERLPYVICMGEFKRPSHMLDHVENVHMRHENDSARFACRHLECQHLGDFLDNLTHFKAHVYHVHGVMLRESRC